MRSIQRARTFSCNHAEPFLFEQIYTQRPDLGQEIGISEALRQCEALPTKASCEMYEQIFIT